MVLQTPPLLNVELEKCAGDGGEIIIGGPATFRTLHPARSTSTLASVSSRRSWRSSATVHPPETRFSTLKHGGKDDLGNATICDAQTGARLRRHPSLWLEDGSVICRAEDTLFCVHMSVLARHSVCFRDMFAVPQPAGGPSLADSLVLEGAGMRSGDQRIPVVTLFDRAEDVANLIDALYNIGTNFGDNNEEDFRKVAGILRLATKYIIDELRDMTLDHLSIAWPSDLKQWDHREDLVRAFEIAAEPGAHMHPHPFDVINLAREVDAPALLIPAFYDLSRYSFSQIFEAQEDDTLYRPADRLPPPLSPADVQRVCVGKEHCQQAITGLIQAMGRDQHLRAAQQAPHALQRRATGGTCASAAACRKDLAELVELATQHYLFDRERGCHDPLYVAEELGQLKSAEVSECRPCARALEMWAAREREKIWKMIPAWFRLDPPLADA